MHVHFPYIHVRICFVAGYNIRNVSRCWTYETSVLLDTPVSNNIPYNDFWSYYGPGTVLELIWCRRVGLLLVKKVFPGVGQIPDSCGFPPRSSNSVLMSFRVQVAPDSE